MKRLPPEVMGAAMGIINTGGTLGGFVAPIVMGYLITVSHGYLSTFIFLALAMVVAGLAMLPLALKTRHALTEEKCDGI
ncbi:Major Facilitator Superfamily protein [compost metagenome]